MFLIISALLRGYSKPGEPISSIKKRFRVVNFRLINFTALEVIDYIFEICIPLKTITNLLMKRDLHAWNNL